MTKAHVLQRALQTTWEMWGHSGSLSEPRAAIYKTESSFLLMMAPEPSSRRAGKMVEGLLCCGHGFQPWQRLGTPVDLK